MTDQDLRDGLTKPPHEPLLPIETTLIGWSLGLGVGLLLVPAAVSRLFPLG